MKVHLISGGFLVVSGDHPVKQDNGLMRFDKIDTTLSTAWVTVGIITNDPLIPITNISYIER